MATVSEVKEDKGKEKEGGKQKEKGRPEGGERFSEEKRLRARKSEWFPLALLS